MPILIDRRSALFAGLAAAWAVPTVAGAQGGVPAWTPTAVSGDQARTLAAACERIMPPTATPGAGAFGVPQFVDRAMAGWCAPAETERLKAGLASLDAAARARFGVGFASATATQQDMLLAEADAEARQVAAQGKPHYFPLLRTLVTTGYFQSRQGCTQVLRYDPAPGAYHGCVPVKEIGRAWAL